MKLADDRAEDQLRQIPPSKPTNPPRKTNH